LFKQSFLEEDVASKDEILEETGIIRVQLGSMRQEQGRDKEAQTIYNQILKNKASEIGLADHQQGPEHFRQVGHTGEREYIFCNI
jgi:hypothetical protein